MTLGTLRANLTGPRILVLMTGAVFTALTILNPQQVYCLGGKKSHIKVVNIHTGKHD